MSGTPWRSDSLPIVMSEYSAPDRQLFVDYQYSLEKAIEGKVCRTPKIVLVNNEHLTLSNDEKNESFSSILEMLRQTKTSYQSVIHNQEAMEYCLALAVKNSQKYVIKVLELEGWLLLLLCNILKQSKRYLLKSTHKQFL